MKRATAMKTLLLAALLLGTTAIALAGQSGQTEGSGYVEISFDYNRLRGFASNQFAVWVETEVGAYLTTVFATEWTAKGGWEKRPLSLARWAKVSNLPQMDQYDVNAVSGPTPKAGRQTFAWDGRDITGKPVPDGRYRIRIEGTLRNENVVIFTAFVQLGGAPGVAEVKTEFFGDETKDRGMLENVRVEYVAGKPR